MVPIACESQMAAITRPSGYCRKAERRAAGSARCGGGIRAAPEASGSERRPEGPAPQPHESRPWRRVHGATRRKAPPGALPHHPPCAPRPRASYGRWKGRERPLCTLSKETPEAGGAGRAWQASADRKWPPHRESFTNPVLANGVSPLLTQTLQLLVSLAVLVDGGS